MSLFAKEAVRTSDQVQDILALVSSFSDTTVQVQGMVHGVQRLESRLQGMVTGGVYA